MKYIVLAIEPKSFFSYSAAQSANRRQSVGRDVHIGQTELVAPQPR
jgi:hypothetical protein